jgi:hypothetical protein
MLKIESYFETQFRFNALAYGKVIATRMSAQKKKRQWLQDIINK